MAIALARMADALGVVPVAFDCWVSAMSLAAIALSGAAIAWGRKAIAWGRRAIAWGRRAIAWGRLPGALGMNERPAIAWAARTAPAVKPAS
jgi:hypothetical protein